MPTTQEKLEKAQARRDAKEKHMKKKQGMVTKIKIASQLQKNKALMICAHCSTPMVNTVPFEMDGTHARTHARTLGLSDILHLSACLAGRGQYQLTIKCRLDIDVMHIFICVYHIYIYHHGHRQAVLL